MAFGILKRIWVGGSVIGKRRKKGLFYDFFSGWDLRLGLAFPLIFGTFFERKGGQLNKLKGEL